MCQCNRVWNQKYINMQDHCVTGFFLAISFNNMAYWVTISMLPVSLLQTNLSGKYLKVQKIGWPSFTVTQFRMLQLLGMGYSRLTMWPFILLFFFAFSFDCQKVLLKPLWMRLSPQLNRRWLIDWLKYTFWCFYYIWHWSPEGRTFY